MSEKAVVLLSGGLDSTTTLAIARDEGYNIYAMSFRYGQRHTVELQCAERVAKALGVTQHTVVDIDLRTFGSSALTADIEVPKDRSDVEMTDNIPITYVPARNTIFLSYALAWAEVLGADTIFIGANAIDYSGYPDCRPLTSPPETQFFSLMRSLGLKFSVLIPFSSEPMLLIIAAIPIAVHATDNLRPTDE